MKLKISTAVTSITVRYERVQSSQSQCGLGVANGIHQVNRKPRQTSCNFVIWYKVPCRSESIDKLLNAIIGEPITHSRQKMKVTATSFRTYTVLFNENKETKNRSTSLKRILENSGTYRQTEVAADRGDNEVSSTSLKGDLKLSLDNYLSILPLSFKLNIKLQTLFIPPAPNATTWTSLHMD